MPEPAALILQVDQWQKITEHLDGCLPEEGCGLIAGSQGTGKLVKMIENQLHSPVRFRMASEEQWRAFQEFEQFGFDLLAIFHSHPKGPQTPSETDLDEFAYPGVFSLICCPIHQRWQARAFWIEDRKVDEVPCMIK